MARNRYYDADPSAGPDDPYGGWGWEVEPPVKAPAPAPAAPAAPVDEGGGGGGGPAGPAAPSAAELFALRKAPGFKAPRFQAPTRESLESDPGYQFRLGSGKSALERSAAARGVLRTGGTLKDLLEYGQKFGSQEYEGAYNRALGAYDRDFQAAQAEFAPQMAEYGYGAQADLARAQNEYRRWYGQGGGGGGGGYEDIPEPPAPPDFGDEGY